MVKNCFNYVGSKDRVLSIIAENIDTSKKNLVDLFCGSGVVGVNLADSFDNILLNDACWQMMATLEYLENPYEKIIGDIEALIKEYGLSKGNKEGYLKLRDYYNENANNISSFRPDVFYCLVTHSFNFNIHLSKNNRFNVPSGAGRCYFNSSLRSKLEAFQKELYRVQDKVEMSTTDFSEVLENVDIPNSTFYVDPPYLSSDSSYCRIFYLKWEEDKERKLYNALDRINAEGGTFLLSNVLENNGRTNVILSKWAKKYNIIDIDVSYRNCNYQRKNVGRTKEVLVRNY